MQPSESQILAVPLERVQGPILPVRGQRVIVDADLARLYEVPTKRSSEQVKRNVERFPDDFAFRLTPQEALELVANCNRFARLKHAAQPPLAFTEHGVIAAAFVLNAPRAVEVSTRVVRAFVQLRRMTSEMTALAQRIERLEQETAHRFRDHDGHLRAIFKTLRDLLKPEAEEGLKPTKPRVGFRADKP